MSTTLLATKLRIPRVPRNLVSRPHLIRRLNDGISGNHRLILISAPAGYGKSTLLSEWVAQLDIPVAWLSLEKEENNTAHFWSYFGGALSNIPHLGQAGIGESMIQAMQSPQAQPVNLLLPELINELSSLETGAVLVLDDLNAISDSQIHQDLVFLIDHLPLSANRLLLVVSSRRDPPWPLARWRARAQLLEVRTADLRFTPEEATDFLNRVMNLGLGAGDVRFLENRTEGWIAGLQMAALSIQGREDAHEFIQAFTGSNRYIFDFLVEEVLSRQKQDVQDFLLKSSILERFCAPLCDVIIGQNDSRLILDQLEKANLFLVPLDDEQTWYRYHRLFADLLFTSLKKKHSLILPELHRRACTWFEEHGFLSEALAHALAASDLDHLAKLVEGYAFTIMEVQEASSLLSWLNSLPDSVLIAYPWLNVARAWLLAYLGRKDLIEQAIELAEESADQTDRRLLGYIAAVRTLACELDVAQTALGIHQARKALELLPQNEFRPRAFVCYHLANILAWHGDDASALMALEEATALSLSAGDLEMAMTAQFEIANFLRYRGKLRQSLHTFERTHQMSATRIPERMLKSLPVGFAKLQQAQIHLEWNDLDESLRLAREGIQICKSWGYSDYLYEGWIIFASILYETGNLDEALTAIGEVTRIFPDLPPGNRNFALEALISQARGDFGSAANWLSACGMSPEDTPDFIHRFEYYYFATILHEQGRLEEADQILEHLRHVVEQAGGMTMVIHLLAQQAIIAHTRGDEARALSLLGRLLKLAEPEGFIHVFVGKGTGMEQLLRKAVKMGIYSDYAGQLLEKSAQAGAEVPPAHILPSLEQTAGSGRPLIEPLSERELEVLRLLNTSLDTKEIAAELYVSVNTVRSHIKNIYGKLGVSRRMQAVERARELKLL